MRWALPVTPILLCDYGPLGRDGQRPIGRTLSKEYHPPYRPRRNHPKLQKFSKKPPKKVQELIYVGYFKLHKVSLNWKMIVNFEDILWALSSLFVFRSHNSFSTAGQKIISYKMGSNIGMTLKHYNQDAEGRHYQLFLTHSHYIALGGSQ